MGRLQSPTVSCGMMRVLIAIFLFVAVAEVACLDVALDQPAEMGEMDPPTLGETAGEHISAEEHATAKAAIKAAMKAKDAASEATGRRGKSQATIRRTGSLMTSGPFHFGQASFQGNFEENAEQRA